MKHFWKTVPFVTIIVVIMIAGILPKESYAAKRKEFRAVWVASVYGIDYPKQATTDSNSLKQQADSILDGAKNVGMTAVILQVRPAADALYPSVYFPWSKYLTGEQGVAPSDGFDPLSYWVSEAHKRGMELHAWLNPFRVANSDTEYEQMSISHIAKQHPDWVVRQANGKYYFNPGIPEVRQFIIDAAAEIVQNYAVDGIHLDDYFYPGTDFSDETTYQQYGSAFVDAGDWRRNNIDRLVAEMHDVTENCGRTVAFGVSPSGIWANSSSIVSGSNTNGNQSYFSAYADSRKWVQNGWLDYICPQLYWNIGHPLADYKTLAEWWAQQVRGTDIKLYVGMADYQTGNKDVNSAWHGINAIAEEIEFNREIAEIAGEVHFSYSNIADSPELAAYYRANYKDAADTAIRLDKMSGEAYITGNNGFFDPEYPLSRAQTAMMLSRLSVDENGTKLYDGKHLYTSYYTDVSEQSWFASPIGFMSENNIMNGYEDGCFYPDKPVTRAEFAALIFRMERGDAVEKTSLFSDVSNEHWAARAVAFAYQKGYLTGYDDGNFRPERAITRAEAVKIINRVSGRIADDYSAQTGVAFADVDEQHWAYYEIMMAATARSEK